MTLLNDLRISGTPTFSIVQIIPGTVIGPSEFVSTRAQARKYIDRQTSALLFDKMKPRYAFGFVHVGDCARVHVEALDEGNVRSEDVPPWFVAAATMEGEGRGEEMWVGVADLIAGQFRREIEEGVFMIGREKVPINMPYRVDSRVTEMVLLGGRKMRGFEECVMEVARWYLSLPEGN